MHPVFIKNTAKEKLRQSIEQAISGYISGFIIGSCSVIGIFIFGWHKIFENIINENMALYTVVSFFSFIFMSWGIDSFLCFFDFFNNDCKNKILLNILKSFIGYTSVTLGFSLGVWVFLYLLSIFHLGEVDSIAKIKNNIYPLQHIIAILMMCFIIFWPYHNNILFVNHKQIIHDSIRNSHYRRGSKLSHRCGYIVTGFVYSLMAISLVKTLVFLSQK